MQGPLVPRRWMLRRQTVRRRGCSSTSTHPAILWSVLAMVFLLQTESAQLLAAGMLEQLHEHAVVRLVDSVAELSHLVSTLFDHKSAYPWLNTSQFFSPAVSCVCTAGDPFTSASCVCAGAIHNEYRAGQQRDCCQSSCHSSSTAAKHTTGGGLVTLYPGVQAVPGRRGVFEFKEQLYTLKHKFASKRQAFVCRVLVKLLAQHKLSIPCDDKLLKQAQRMGLCMNCGATIYVSGNDVVEIAWKLFLQAFAAHVSSRMDCPYDLFSLSNQPASPPAGDTAHVPNIYCEPQEACQCGVHALNALMGGKVVGGAACHEHLSRSMSHRLPNELRANFSPSGNYTVTALNHWLYEHTSEDAAIAEVMAIGVFGSNRIYSNKQEILSRCPPGCRALFLWYMHNGNVPHYKTWVEHGGVWYECESIQYAVDRSIRTVSDHDWSTFQGVVYCLVAADAFRYGRTMIHPPYGAALTLLSDTVVTLAWLDGADLRSRISADPTRSVAEAFAADQSPINIVSGDSDVEQVGDAEMPNGKTHQQRAEDTSTKERPNIHSMTHNCDTGVGSETTPPKKGAVTCGS